MQYKKFKELSLSALGFGAMRMPVKNGVYADIDEELTEKMVDYAMEQGINYFDTAWGYHDGESEKVIGRCLGKYPRESFYLADKFPGYDLANIDKVEEIFEEQLKKCGVTYFDFYLFHNVCEMNIDAYLDEKYGIHAYLMKQKENGRIRHLGFSAHGDMDVLKRFLEKYGKDMEFCQLQINYYDWEFQNAKEKVALMKEYGIPVWVMEPLRGGKLVNLSEKHQDILKQARPGESMPGWAFRYLQGIPEVVVTLSGMSDFEQLRANIETFKEDKTLNEKEMEALSQVVDDMLGRSALPCTSCRYCTKHCPKGLDIPKLIKYYNEHRSTKDGFIVPMALSTMKPEELPGACIGCKKCESVCPQQIKISEMMKDFSKMMADEQE